MLRHIAAFVYGNMCKPVLFRMAPDGVHEKMIRTGSFAQKLGVVAPVLRASWAHGTDPRLEQRVFGMNFANPIGLSAGLDKNAEIVPMLQAVGFGVATVGAISADAAPGNPRPWFYRLPQSKSLVVNAGLPNHGAGQINERILSYRSAIFDDFPLVASVAKTNSPKTGTDNAGVADYVEGVEKLRFNPHIAMFELNISCPNAYGGEPFTRCEPLETLLSDIDALELTQPVTIKMPIDKTWKEFDELLKVIVRHNVAAVTIGNLQKNRAAVPLKDELPEAIRGNLSGKPCFDQSNDLIYRTYAKYGDRLTIIGVGGVFSAEDAYEKVKRGATLVELITGLIFNGPQLIGQINHDLAELLASDGYENVADAVGATHRK